MPNLKASIKDERKTKRRTKENLRIRRKYRGAMKDVNSKIAKGETKELPSALSRTYKLLDKAAKKKLLKKNTVARKKARLTKKVNKVIDNSASDVKNIKKDS
jgi:small subunit ribosomal protein S20